VRGIQDLLHTLGSMIAVALGVLCGYPLYRSLAATLRRLPWSSMARLLGRWRAGGNRVS
jgi:hypothetical protein